MSGSNDSGSKIVGLSLNDGSIVELAMGQVGPSSDNVSEVIIPTSVPWRDSVQLFRTPLEFAGSEERPMGGETVWAAEYFDTIPNSTSEFSIEAIFMEYPGDDFQLVDINETEAVSFAHFQAGDLKPYIQANI
jgi:hypothetical protein